MSINKTTFHNVREQSRTVSILENRMLNLRRRHLLSKSLVVLIRIVSNNYI